MNFSLKSSFSAEALARQERYARTREFFFAEINNPKSQKESILFSPLFAAS